MQRKFDEYFQKTIEYSFANCYYLSVVALGYYIFLRRSILVRSAVYQEGPKNPLKGISLKPLVSALNAQFGVGAGGKCGKSLVLGPYLRSQGALQWHGEPDPVYVETCSCAGMTRTKQA